MNTENRYPVTASLFMLKEIKHRQEQVKRGYQLLRRKAEALRFRGRQAAAELAATQAIMGHTLKEAYISLAAIKFTNGESNALVLENIGQAQVRVQRIPENISGVATVSLQAIEETGASDALRYAGLGAGGHRTGETKKAFREVVRMLIKFASLRNTCILLDEAIKTTLRVTPRCKITCVSQELEHLTNISLLSEFGVNLSKFVNRKVNGIEKVIMPKLRNTETYILMEMDEREREDFHRLKMVKAKKVKNQVMVRTTAGDGEIDDTPSTHSSNEHPAEYITSILDHCALSSTTDSVGDYKPICYPHGWDDDDLLF